MAEERVKRILLEGASVPVNLKQRGQLPPWYDPVKFKRGQLFFQKNYFALFVSKLAGLIILLAITTVLRVLILTGKSGDKISAYKRYMGTIHHMLMWYDGDLQDPKSRACKSLMTVRGFHCAASLKANGVGYGHITQRDMAITQFGFMGFAIVRFKELGLKGSSEMVEGFVHFWKIIGHLMGIEERFNLCSGSVEETEDACKMLLDQLFVPSVERKASDFISMSTALMEGMKPVCPFIDKHAFMAITRHFCGLKYEDYLIDMKSRIIFKWHLYVHQIVLNTAVISFLMRPFLNFLVWFGLFLCRRFPLVTAIHFGRKIEMDDLLVDNVFAPKAPHSVPSMMAQAMSSRVGSGSNRLAEQDQGGAAGLVVMVAVLCFMLAYCCWGAPCCRHATDDSTDSSRASTPNILLFPHGRILLLDQSLITHFQPDLRSLDMNFPQSGEGYVQRQRAMILANRSNPYTTSYETDSDKDNEHSPSEQGIPPPMYDSLSTRTSSSSNQSFPPPYDEIVLLDINDRGLIAESRV